MANVTVVTNQPHPVPLMKVSATCEKVNESIVSTGVCIVAALFKYARSEDQLVEFRQPSIREVDQHPTSMHTLYKLLLITNEPQATVRLRLSTDMNM